MIFVGERINTGFKDIKQAVLDKDPKPLQEWAKKQTEAGANYLDINLGAVFEQQGDVEAALAHYNKSCQLGNSLGCQNYQRLSDTL